MKQSLCSTRKILIGLIACLLFAGIPAAMAAVSITAEPSTGSTVTVITFPAGAAVYLNSEFRGTTPVKLGDLPPGTYQIDVSLAGYRNETFRRTLSEGSVLEIGINLESLSSLPVPTGSGSIAVDSSPGGAAVLLDGKPAGTTPAGRAALILNDVPAGNHTITVQLAGYPVYSGTVTVIKNRVVKVNAGLETAGPTIPATPVATTSPRKSVPLSPLTAVAAACLTGLAMALRRT